MFQRDARDSSQRLIDDSAFDLRDGIHCLSIKRPHQAEIERIVKLRALQADGHGAEVEITARCAARIDVHTTEETPALDQVNTGKAGQLHGDVADAQIGDQAVRRVFGSANNLSVINAQIQPIGSPTATRNFTQ